MSTSLRGCSPIAVKPGEQLDLDAGASMTHP
jgi:hypothetical protein